MKADGGCTCNSKPDTYFFDKFPYCRTKGPSCKTFTNGTSSTTVLVPWNVSVAKTAESRPRLITCIVQRVMVARLASNVPHQSNRFCWRHLDHDVVK